MKRPVRVCCLLQHGGANAAAAAARHARGAHPAIQPNIYIYATQRSIPQPGAHLAAGRGWGRCRQISLRLRTGTTFCRTISLVALPSHLPTPLPHTQPPPPCPSTTCRGQSCAVQAAERCLAYEHSVHDQLQRHERPLVLGLGPRGLCAFPFPSHPSPHLLRILYSQTSHIIISGCSLLSTTAGHALLRRRSLSSTRRSLASWPSALTRRPPWPATRWSRCWWTLLASTGRGASRTFSTMSWLCCRPARRRWASPSSARPQKSFLPPLMCLPSAQPSSRR